MFELYGIRSLKHYGIEVSGTNGACFKAKLSLDGDPWLSIVDPDVL
jgi:hypothetical protein